MRIKLTPKDITAYKQAYKAEIETNSLNRKIGFKTAQINILDYINSHRRPLDKGGIYYRLSVEDIINYIEKMEYKS